MKNGKNLAVLRNYRLLKPMDLDVIMPDLNAYMKGNAGRDKDIPKNTIQKYEAGNYNLDNMYLEEFYCSYFGISKEFFSNGPTKFRYQFLVPVVDDVRIDSNSRPQFNASVTKSRKLLLSDIGVISNIVEMKVDRKRQFVLLSKTPLYALDATKAHTKFKDSLGETPGGDFDAKIISKTRKHPVFGRLNKGKFSFYSARKPKKETDVFFGIVIDNDRIMKLEKTVPDSWITYLGKL